MKDRGVLKEVVIATKVPPKNSAWDPPLGVAIGEEFPADWIIKCCERSLKHLGHEWVDILQLHTWNPSWAKRVQWYEAMLRLKEQGKIRVIGISVSAVRHDEANPQIEKGRVECIQVIHNVLDQSAEKTLFPLAGKDGVGVCARHWPQAALTGRFTRATKFPKGDWRNDRPDKNWVGEMVAQVEKIGFLTEDGTPLAHTALKYCLASPMVSSVIPGIRNARQAEANFSASDGNLLKVEAVERLREMYRKHEIGALFYT